MAIFGQMNPYSVLPTPANAPSQKGFDAEQGLANAQQKIKDAIFELGKVYYEKNKEEEVADFIEDIQTINKYYEEEHLWTQYKYSLEDKMLCDSCKAIITSDSAFCNKCGSPVKLPDFTPIIGKPTNVEAPKPVEVEASKPAACPKCGRELVKGAMFCEGCGERIS